MTTAAYFFWIAATMNVAASVAFVIYLQSVARRNKPKDYFGLARGQRLDGWLASGTIWVVILSRGHPTHDGCALFGGIALCWLLMRTAERFRSLQQKR